MQKLVEPKRALHTLVRLWSGKRCPHEKECICRRGDWCPQARGRPSDGERDYPMLHLAGCSLGYESCCCRVLDEIEALAAEYLMQANVRQPPVPLDVVNLFDPHRPIELRSLPLKAYCGCTWFVDKEWVIHLNANEPPVANRFTTFHEGFHIVCRNTGLTFSRAGDCYKPLSERLADYFSASILMPRTFVYSLWPKVQNLSELADIFGVPEHIAEYWLTRLGVYNK